jgi:hypothetical protein
MSKPSDKLKTGKAVQHKAADYDSVLGGVTGHAILTPMLMIADLP